jgi:hypothetical protein
LPESTQEIHALLTELKLIKPTNTMDQKQAQARLSMSSTTDILQELRRELAMRRKLYPKWVSTGRLPKATAEHRMAVLESAIELIESTEPQQQTLL